MAISQEEMAQLRTRLEEERARLEADLARIAVKDDSGYETKFPEDVGDRTDENASEVEMFADNAALQQDLERQLIDVRDALAKMDAGTYGICEKTGREIPLARLQAYPAARTVVDA